jgi:hypothetical protein
MTAEERDLLRQAEDTEFPLVADDKVWCPVRALIVDVTECATGCAAPEQRPVCWNGHVAEVVA